MFVYRKSVLTKLVGNILDPTVFSKTGEIGTSVRNGTKAHFMCFLLIYQGEFLSSDTLNLKCIVCDREKKTMCQNLPFNRALEFKYHIIFCQLSYQLLFTISRINK